MTAANIRRSLDYADNLRIILGLMSHYHLLQQLPIATGAPEKRIEMERGV